ncbi:unnamed protein product [Rotaria sp. Silwood1]|nr:unnamed protein product [Rotaria sp. Silwood1]
MLSPSSIARESFFLLAPLESLHCEDVKNITSIEELKKTKIDEQFVRYCIGEYKPAIVTYESEILVLHGLKEFNDKAIRRFSY